MPHPQATPAPTTAYPPPQTTRPHRLNTPPCAPPHTPTSAQATPAPTTAYPPPQTTRPHRP
ncbi:hypothetical protein MNL04_06765 [Bartonella krasnovii]|uniref:hypothetical protein n=1 Tax=Bartonella krasnovii TaxID=2267275 RepID=UPI001F4C7F81|nr:hypothetical protein [Bartonella krasnovii]UNF48394.1 hypothetical protein MNL04_06765 [Bartonella krasnovii]